MADTGSCIGDPLCFAARDFHSGFPQVFVESAKMAARFFPAAGFAFRFNEYFSSYISDKQG